MATLAGYRVSDELLDAWAQGLVFEREPIYVTNEERHLLPPGTPLWTPEELGRAVDVPFKDAYFTYHVQAPWLALLPPALARQLPPVVQRLQGQVGRGQVYDAAFVAGVLGEVEPADRRTAAVLLAQDAVATPDSEQYLLRWDVWQQLPRGVRHAWLWAVVSEDLAPCLAATLSEAEWSVAEAACGPAIRSLAGTFATRSGPNCFTTALAAVLPELAQAQATAGLWLHPEPFVRALTDLGRKPVQLTTPAEAAPGSVLVWEDAAGRPLHAAVAIGGGLVFQKPAQVWWAPRQVVTLEHVVGEWLETLAAGGRLLAYVRG